MDGTIGAIDPALLEDGPSGRMPSATDGATASHCQPSASTSTASRLHPARRHPAYTKEDVTSWAFTNYAPRRDADESRQEYNERLSLVTRRAPLIEACSKLSVKHPQSASLNRLREGLAKYWFSPSSSRIGPSQHTVIPLPPVHPHRNETPNFNPPGNPLLFPPAPGLVPTVSSTARGEFRGSVPLFHTINPATTRKAPNRTQASSSATEPFEPLTPVSHRPPTTRFVGSTPSSSQPLSVEPFEPAPQSQSNASHADRAEPESDEANDDISDLIRQYGVEGANAEELLGYDDDPEEEEGEDENEDEEEAVNVEGEDSSDEEAAHNAFKRRTRVQAVERAEGNRRVGGIRTQQAIVKDYIRWQRIAREQETIKDDIIDEHALLLYIQYSAEREKRTRRGEPIFGSRLGASHLKKLYFGVLRMRKGQDAADPALARDRPAATFVVWEAIKCRMDEALQRVRNGLGKEEEDAPDIRANTFLPEVTEQQLEDVGHGFLGHRQLRLSIFGHLAWSAQNASGNRGDDFRALKLSELQPYTMTHPDGRTAVFTVLGLQGEEKAGKRGMRTVVNPSYTAFVANVNPEICPLGAFGFYVHYIHDVLDIASTLNIDWAWNKSWRQVRILHGQKSPNTPYSEQALYNLYSKAFSRAGFSSRMKAHLPRHLLGYKQEKMNVDAADTSKLGWVRGATYFDTYAPALPKKAILGAAGFKTDEMYDPVWTRVYVPPQFLSLVCPKAETICEELANRENLSGAFNYWQMIIKLRPYTLQSGAAIYQKCPKSALFRLPIFANHDVQNWMKTSFPTDLALLQAKQGNREDLLLVENAILRKSLEDLYRISDANHTKLVKLTELMERRTSVLSPAKGFSAVSYHQNVLAFSSPSTSRAAVSDTSSASPIIVHFDQEMRETGTYELLDAEGTSSMRAFANGSPTSPGVPRTTTQVDLELPKEAFYKAGGPVGVVPPVFGQRSARWPDVFGFIQRPSVCWPVWKPKSVDSYSSVDEIWTSWVDGAPVFKDGVQTGIKPPLKLVEQYLQNRWRTPEDKKERSAAAQHWGRYREIPEWIESESQQRGCSPSDIVTELEAKRVIDGQKKGLNYLRQQVEALRKQAARAAKAQTVDVSPSSSIGSMNIAVQTQTLGPAFQELPEGTGRKRALADDPRRTAAVKKGKK